MKKIIIFIFLLIYTIPSLAQWKVETQEDDYTLEKYYILTYTKSRANARAVYFPDTEKIRIAYVFDGLKYFDQTWDATIENNAVIDGRKIYGSCRVINSDKTYEEFFGPYYMWFTGFDRAGDTFAGCIDIEMDPSLLKKGQYLTVRISNPFIDDHITMKISLAGFTAAYNRTLK